MGDLLVWLVLGVMLGGRVGWWLFYHRSAGAAPEPWYEPFAIWHGGMSFHGGLLGVTIASIAWTRLNGESLWNVADALALVTPIGLFFGRIANFINAELIGRPTTLPWGVVYPGEPFARHPSQLYRSAARGRAAVRAALALRRWRTPADGCLAAAFLAVYGAMRFAVEFTRAPDVQLGFLALGWLTMGQLLSGLMVVTGTALWVCAAMHRPRGGHRSCRRRTSPPVLETPSSRRRLLAAGAAAAAISMSGSLAKSTHDRRKDRFVTLLHTGD